MKIQCFVLKKNIHYETIQKQIFRSLNSLILVFNMTKSIETSNLEYWLNELIINHNKLLSCIIMDNKIDFIKYDELQEIKKKKLQFCK